MQDSATKAQIPDFTSIGDERKRIDAMCTWALRMRNVAPDPCLELGTEALRQARQCGYRESEALALAIIGYQHWHRSEIDIALQELAESESIQEETGYYRHWGETQMIKAMIAWGKGNYDEAFSTVYTALKRLENYKPFESHAWLYWTLGVFHYDLKDYARSLVNYEKALPLFQAIEPPDPNTVSYTLIGIGCCNKAEGENRRALEHFREALKLSLETHQWMQEARCHYELGLIEYENGNLDEARKELEKSYAMRKEHGTKPGMASCLLALADVERSGANLSAAMEQLREALTLATETDTKPKMYQCHEKMAMLYKQKGDFEKALEHNEQFHKLRSEVVGEQANNKLKALETKFATEQAEKEAEIQRLRNVELKKAHDLVAEKNKEITDSIQYARRIQSAILPSLTLVKKYMKESFILYKPKDIVAGDFYWMEMEGEKIFFTAADCTGHGVPGAMVSVMCSTALSKAVKELGIHQPAKILDKTVDLLEERFAKSEEEVKDGMDLALCCLNLSMGTLEYAGANNPLYHIRNNELLEITADKQPVGKHDYRQPYTNHTLDIRTGDCFYIFSDGFADQFGGPDGKKFKYKSFRELLMDIHRKPMNEQKNILDKTFEDWKGPLEQVDDICIIGLRI